MAVPILNMNLPQRGRLMGSSLDISREANHRRSTYRTLTPTEIVRGIYISSRDINEYTNEGQGEKVHLGD